MENSQEILQLTKQRNRWQIYYDNAYKWLNLLQEGTDLYPYFTSHQCRKIAIYGIADFGKMLQKELNRNGEIKVEYFMDRNAVNCRKVGDIPVYSPDEILIAPEVDMMVVTAIAAYETVSKMLLEKKPEMPVVSLKSIIETRTVEVWTW